jgi:hypothetical protein
MTRQFSVSQRDLSLFLQKYPQLKKYGTQFPQDALDALIAFVAAEHPPLPSSLAFESGLEDADRNPLTPPELPALPVEKDPRVMMSVSVGEIPAVVQRGQFEIGPSDAASDSFERFTAREKTTGKTVFVTQWKMGFHTICFVPSVSIQSRLTFPGVAKLIAIGHGLSVEEFAPLGTFGGAVSARVRGQLPAGITATTFSKVWFGVAVTMEIGRAHV